MNYSVLIFRRLLLPLSLAVPLAMSLALASFMTPASATSLLPVSLQQLSTRASLIFYAEVISNETRTDPQSARIATFTEFKILDLIKGNTGGTHIIKQLGGYDKTSHTRVHVHGVPDFETGKQYVVFLPEPSALGFCSPLGLHQGSFPVLSRGDELIVHNGHHLRQQPAIKTMQQRSPVQLPLAVDTQNPSQARLDDFTNTIRAYNTP